jgi:hypothetical protein
MLWQKRDFGDIVGLGQNITIKPQIWFLLAKGRDGITSWDTAAWYCRKYILEKLWGLGTELQLKLKDDMLLAKGMDGITAWDRAAEKGNTEILKTLWGWDREAQDNL